MRRARNSVETDLPREGGAAWSVPSPLFLLYQWRRILRILLQVHRNPVSKLYTATDPLDNPLADHDSKRTLPVFFFRLDYRVTNVTMGCDLADAMPSVLASKVVWRLLKPQPNKTMILVLGGNSIA